MKATDLRIGNLVNYLGEVQEVTGIDSEYVYLDTITFDYVEHDEIEPIPLTEEWLLKLGFDDSEYKKGYTGIEYRSNVILDFVLTKPLVMGEWQKDYCFELVQHRFVEIKYIHELQNLYHAITGNELKIKE